LRFNVCSDGFEKRKAKAHPFFQRAKIVQGECNGKGKSEDFLFPLPGRRLFYEKIVQGECNGKGKSEDFPFPLPGRRLSYKK